jgi:alpha-beta hydrolase superfamily lysophospholipase
MLRTLIFLVILIFVQGALGKEISNSIWFKTSQLPPRSITIVAHGLNLKPEKMNSIVTVLNEGGSDVLRVSLKGHTGNEEEFKKVTRNEWIQNIFSAYKEARETADGLGIPLYFVGFSLGALINLDLMNSFPETAIEYDRMILFAPALVVKNTSYLVKTFYIFGSNFVVPSAMNKSYRANEKGTPLAAYSALFDSISRLKKIGINQQNIPTLIMIDPKDELVSASGLREMIEENQLFKWRIFNIQKKNSQLKTNYHHLIIDEASVGLDEWTIIKNNIREHFRLEYYKPRF